MSDFQKDFVDLVFSFKDRALLEDFLMGVTTPKERQTLAQRVEIIKRINMGEPHHKIAGDLHVGVATVTRGSKELSQGRFKTFSPQETWPSAK
ncbi:MAG TPA: Trp family transcriptional regulator [Candidatus Saccharimonadales bacterium]|nr:Trp family transcriptional regulator [Candidatus Saccharimonadales bacterium]